MNALLGLGIIGVLLFIMALVVIPILASIFWIWMLVDCATRNFKNKNDKVVWILVIILLHIIGAMIYYFLIRKKIKKRI